VHGRPLILLVELSLDSEDVAAVSTIAFLSETFLAARLSIHTRMD
jgi:hypothetical protein